MNPLAAAVFVAAGYAVAAVLWAASVDGMIAGCFGAAASVALFHLAAKPDGGAP